MALFTDGQINSPPELERYDGSVLDIAAAEGVDVTAKAALAQDEVGEQILQFLLTNAYRDFRWNVRRQYGLADVVVTPALKRWHAFEALAQTYAEAYSNEPNARYERREQQCRAAAKDARGALLDIGVGLVFAPVPKAGQPVISGGAINTQTATIFVAASWLNFAGEEGMCSDAVPVDGSTGTVQVQAPVPTNTVITGWNIYAGLGADSMGLQNSSALSLAQTWTVNPSALSAGRLPGAGQVARQMMPRIRVIPRG